MEVRFLRIAFALHLKGQKKHKDMTGRSDKKRARCCAAPRFKNEKNKKVKVKKKYTFGDPTPFYDEREGRDLVFGRVPYRRQGRLYHIHELVSTNQ